MYMNWEGRSSPSIDYCREFILPVLTSVNLPTTMEHDLSDHRGRRRAPKYAHLPARPHSGSEEDIPACPTSPRPSDYGLGVEEDFGLFDVPAYPPSPCPSNLDLEEEEPRLFDDRSACRPSPRPSNLDLGEEEVGLFDDIPACPPSPHPSNTGLHVDETAPHSPRIGEGSPSFVHIEKAYADYVELVVAEDYSGGSPYLIEYPYADIGMFPFTLFGEFQTRVWTVQGFFPAHDVSCEHPNIQQVFHKAVLWLSPHFIFNLLERHSGHWSWFWDKKFSNYGQKRKCWFIAVLHPLYQARIDQRFKLLARAFFDWKFQTELLYP